MGEGNLTEKLQMCIRDRVILTGGHSQWYFVKEILTGRLPAVCGSLLPQITEDPNRILSVARPQETVALGLVYAPMASFSGSPAGLADAGNITEDVYVMDADGFGGASKSAASPVVLPEPCLLYTSIFLREMIFPAIRRRTWRTGITRQSRIPVRWPARSSWGFIPSTLQFTWYVYSVFKRLFISCFNRMYG